MKKFYFSQAVSDPLDLNLKKKLTVNITHTNLVYFLSKMVNFLGNAEVVRIITTEILMSDD